MRLESSTKCPRILLHVKSHYRQSATHTTGYGKKKISRHLFINSNNIIILPESICIMHEVMHSTYNSSYNILLILTQQKAALLKIWSLSNFLKSLHIYYFCNMYENKWCHDEEFWPQICVLIDTLYLTFNT